MANATKGVQATQTSPSRKQNATTTRPYRTTTRIVDPTERPATFTLSQSTAHDSSIPPRVDERLLCANGLQSAQSYQSVVDESQRPSDSPPCQVMFRCSPRPPIILELESPTMSEVCADACQICLSESGKCCSQCLGGTPYCVCKTVHYAIIGSVACVAAPNCVAGYLGYCVVAAGTAAVHFAVPASDPEYSGRT